MLFGATGQCITMVLLAILGSISNSASNIVSAVLLFVFNSFFAIGLIFLPFESTSYLPAGEYRLAGNDMALCEFYLLPVKIEYGWLIGNADSPPKLLVCGYVRPLTH